MEKDRTKKVALIVLSITFLLLVSVSHAWDIFAFVTVISGGDTTPPVVTIIYPWNRTFYKSSLDLNFTVNEPTSWIGYSLDNKPNVNITGNTTLTGLSNSSHNVIVYATDLAGNTGSNATYFTVTTIGDINGDCKVDVKDLVLVIKYFGSYPGKENWNPNADINFDNKVDIKDLVLVNKYFGTYCHSL
jgi:hypothetical protein